MVDAFGKAVAVFDEQFSLIYGNHRFESLFGTHILSLFELLSAENQHSTFKLSSAIRLDGYWSGLVPQTAPNQPGYRVKVEALPGKTDKYVAVFEAEYLKLVESASVRSMIDELTKLPNRYAFNAALKRRIEVSNGTPDFAVIYIDLDHFKDINELHGHEVGDHLLQLCASKIRQLLRREDTLARVSGDEFAAIVGCEQSHEMQYLCHRLMRSFERPVKMGGREFQFTLSIGVAFFPEQGNTPTELVINAEKAMFNAKKQGRAQFQLFDRQHSIKVEKEQRLAETLRRELKQCPEHFTAAFQPLYSVQSGQFIGVEVLSRWHSPDLGSVSPAEFIPLAEARGLINDISARLFEDVMDNLGPQETFETHRPLLAINVSAQQIQDKIFEHLLIAFSQRVQEVGWQLEVELTESQLMSHADGIAEKLQDWRDKGIRIAIDDFGTGYSCLAYLHTLPIDKLKIDRQFMQSQTPTRREDEILYAILSMANALNIDVLAEGIETIEQFRRLQELGCAAGQGFGLARPQPWHPDLLSPLPSNMV
jgi:diguanylate cyclase (GGDEF)-like protein